MNKIEYVKGDALEWAKKDGYCMIHVCNNKGAFGGGRTALATQVKERYSQAYSNYLRNYKLGSVTAGGSSSDVIKVINLVAQDGYGARWKGVKYFKEEAFEECLKYIVNSTSLQILEWAKVKTIVVPYKMGADRAGGDWDWIIKKIEELLLPHFKILVVEYEV